MKFRMILLSALILFGAAELLHAQECRIEYTWVEGNWPNQVEKSNIVTVQPGQNQTVNQMHITQIVNNGRNDAIIRTRNNANNAPADYHTINNGNQTIWLPLPNFSGTRLDRVTCLSYATVNDANDLISEFGGSAQNLINNAQTAATQGAQLAKNTMIDLVNVTTYENLQQQFGQNRQVMEQKWEQLQQLAADGANVGDLLLSQHFPELHEAIEATASLNINLPSRMMQNHQQNVQRLETRLHEMDGKYQVSSNINAFASIDLEDQFPELFALGSYQCEIDMGLFDQFSGEFSRFFFALQNMLAGYIPESGLPVFNFTADEINQLTGIFAPPPCLNELIEYNQLVVRDLHQFMDFVTDIQSNLSGWQAEWFVRGNESVYQDSRNLLESSGRLMQLLQRQRELEQAATDAREEMDESYARLERSYGRFSHAGEALPTFIDQLLNPRDAEQIQQDANEHQAAVERYQRTLAARDSGWQNIGREADGWSRDAASLASSVSRLRLNFTLVTDFSGLMGRPVELNFPAETIRLVQSCIISANQSAGTALNIFSGAFERYFSELNALIQSMIPDELYAALELRQSLIAQVEAGINARTELARSAAELGRSYVQLGGAYTDLGLVLAQNPLDPGYISMVDSKVENLSEQASQISQRYASFDQERANAAPELSILLNVVTEVRASLELHRGGLHGDLVELLNLSISLESMLRGMNDMSDTAKQCISDQLTLVQQALNIFPLRMEAFMKMTGELAMNLVPEEVKLHLGNLIGLTGDQISNYAELAQAYAEYQNLRQQTFVPAQQAALNALIPVPQADVESKLQDLMQAFETMYAQIDLMKSVTDNITNTDQQAVQELAQLTAWSINQGNEIQKDVAELVHIVFDASTILSDLNQASGVYPLWADAINMTPQHVSGLLANEIAQRLEPLRSQVEQALQQLTTQTTAAISCTADAIQSRTTIANQSVNTATTQATSGITSTAHSVFSNLQSLLNPNANVLNTVQQVITAGKSLMQDVQQSASAGQSVFESLMSTPYQQMQQAITCVNNRSATIQQRIDDLLVYYDEIEGASQPAQLQLIPAGFNINPDN